jgi:membrane dipeptidase
VGAQFWSVYVPSEMQGKEAVRATLEQIDIVHRMMKRWPETFELALTADRWSGHLSRPGASGR